MTQLVNDLKAARELPWHVSRKFVFVNNSNNQVVAELIGAPDERRKHGHLIAAAPDLLAAAQRVLAHLNARIDAAPSSAKPVFDGIAELHAAIDKAIQDAESGHV